MQETPEVTRTSAGRGADPSTTKRDLYAAVLNRERERCKKTRSAVELWYFKGGKKLALRFLSFHLLSKRLFGQYCDRLTRYTVNFLSFNVSYILNY